MALQTKTFSVSKNTFTLKLTVIENSTSVSGNSSNVSYKLELISTTKDFYQYGVGASVSLDGRVVATRDRYTAPQIGIGTHSSVTLLSGSTTIWHNNDGSKSMNVAYSLDMVSTRYTPGPMSGSGSMALTVIPREAKMTGAPNFTDDDNPTITYSNPANLPIYAYIEVVNQSRPIAERKITGSSYTFQFTEAERNVLRSLNTTSNTQPVRFVVRTDMGGYPMYSWLDRTLSIKNPNPTLNPKVVDTNSQTTALTGNSSCFVRYYSNAKVTFGAQAVKGASLVASLVVCGGKSRTSDGTIKGVENGKFSFSVTDSRGNTTTKSVTKTMVNYVKLSCNIGSEVPDGSGNFTFTVSGAFFNGSFGAATNSLTVKYRYRVVGGTYSSYRDMQVSKSGNSYTATVNITGLDYTKTYQFQAQATDKLATATTPEKSIRSVPVFDWSQTDFNFNVPVTVQGVQLFKNNVLWSGDMWLTGTQKAYLSAPVSKQQTGIVLVFSNYDVNANQANNWDFNFLYIPKAFVSGYPGFTSVNFFAHPFGEYATIKMIKVYDTYITGDGTNNSSGPYGPGSTGITTTNNKQVLRFVIGV